MFLIVINFRLTQEHSVKDTDKEKIVNRNCRNKHSEKIVAECKIKDRNIKFEKWLKWFNRSIRIRSNVNKLTGHIEGTVFVTGQILWILLIPERKK